MEPKPVIFVAALMLSVSGCATTPVSTASLFANNVFSSPKELSRTLDRRAGLGLKATIDKFVKLN